MPQGIEIEEGEIPFNKVSVDLAKGEVRLSAELPVKLVMTLREAESLLKNLERGVEKPFRNTVRFGTVFDGKRLTDKERSKLLKILSAAVPHGE